MDQIKTGKLIALLRRQAGLTQEELGERLGVSNKTVSRWENGNYMPDIEMLQLLAKEFDVSINELLAGEKVSGKQFLKMADASTVVAPTAGAKNIANDEAKVGTIITASANDEAKTDVNATAGAFTFEDKKAYFIRKWRKEHIGLFLILGAVLLAAIILPFFFDRPGFLGLTPLIAVIEYAYQNNKMMIYVEKNLYD